MQQSEILTGFDKDIKNAGEVSEHQITKRTASFTRTSATQKKRKPGSVTINCLDYSTELDIIAFGTVHAQICVLDSSTMSFVGQYEAHSNEVQQIYFYEKELQLLTMSNDGEICLWDA